MNNNIHVQSFGSIKHYANLIVLVEHNRYYWRKVARSILKLRRHLHPWPFVDKNNQRQSATEYVKQALVDIKLPDNVKSAFKDGIVSEFNLQLS